MTAVASAAASTGSWPLHRLLSLIAGSVTLTCVVLAVVLSPWFLLVPAVVGANQLLIFTTGWCPMSPLLARLGTTNQTSKQKVNPPSGTRAASQPAVAAVPPARGTVTMCEPSTRPRSPAKPLLVLAAVSLMFAAGCSSTSPMMNGGGNGGAMMSNGTSTMPGYNYSRLTCTAPPTTTTTVHVVLADMGMSSMMSGTAPMNAHMMLRSTPATLHAGAVTFAATNRGWRTHELVILPLTAGATAGHRVPAADGKVSETGSLGEASTPCGAGPGSGIPAGSASWTTITLPAGRYELVCNLPNHYADGMHQEFDVT